MYQGGDRSLQDWWEGFDSPCLHNMQKEENNTEMIMQDTFVIDKDHNIIVNGIMKFKAIKVISNDKQTVIDYQTVK